MKRGTPRHPKTFALLRALDLPVRQLPVAIGYLELLWHFTSDFAPQGNIGKYPDDQIEAACSWSGKRGKLIEAFTNSGWCDKSDRFRLVVHDWHEHADTSVKKKLERAKLSFLTVTEKVSGHRPHQGANPENNGSLPMPVPMPVPEPLRTPTLSRPLEEWVSQLYERHPKKRNLPLVETALMSALGKSKEPDRLIAEIDRVHALWCETENWTKSNAQYCPKLDEWIADRGFTKLPASRDPPALPPAKRWVEPTLPEEVK